MAINIIKKNTTERIYVSALDEDNEYLTGLTDVLIQIKRKSDGYFLDFNDDTFKASGWTEKEHQMTEDSGLTGTYYYDFVVPNTEEIYIIRVTSETADNSPFDDELRVINTDLNTLNDIIKRILGLTKENQRIFSPVYSNGYLTSATIKIYETADDCTNDTNALATYSVTATYSGSEMQTYKVVKN